ncbi:MAG TPA: hypothetical protein VGL93_32320 [Streptosporangiaceae bacterium]
MRLRTGAAALVAAVTLAACGAGPGTDPDSGVRSAIVSGLRAQGHEAEADIAAGKADVTPEPAAFLGGGWRIYRVDGNGPDAVQFSVGTGPGGKVMLLTGAPAAFGLMTDAAGTRVRTPAAATAVVRVFLRVTRRTDVLSYAVDRVGQIRFRPGLSGTDAAHRDAIVRRYRSVIGPPRARTAAGGFAVTAYSVRDRGLLRHRMDVAVDGAVTDHAKALVTDLPVPYTR